MSNTYRVFYKLKKVVKDFADIEADSKEEVYRKFCKMYENDELHPELDTENYQLKIKLIEDVTDDPPFFDY